MDFLSLTPGKWHVLKDPNRARMSRSPLGMSGICQVCVTGDICVMFVTYVNKYHIYIYIYIIYVYMYILCIYYVYVTKKMSHEAKYLKQNHRSACMVWSQGWFSFMMLCSIWDQKGYIWVHVDQERVWGSTCGRTPPQQFYRLGKIAVPW